MAKKKVHWDVIGWICVGVVLMSLPVIPLLIVKSTMGNILCWVIFICCSMFLLIKGPPVAINIFLCVLLLAIYSEALPHGRIWSYGLAFAQTSLLWSGYYVHSATLGYDDESHL